MNLDNTSPAGIDLIAAERRRQIDTKGFDAAHDDEHVRHELALAAVCYAAPERIYIEAAPPTTGRHFLDPWPINWDPHWDNRPRSRWTGHLVGADDIDLPTRIRCLTKAGALLAAEIDRLQRRRRDQVNDGADDGASTRHYPPLEDRTED